MKLQTLFALLVSVGALVGLSRCEFSPKENPAFVKTMRDMMHIKDVLKEYRKKCGKFPSTEEGLAHLERNSCPGYSAAQISKVDQWGNRFSYTSSQDTYRLSSSGESWLETSPTSDFKVIQGGKTVYESPESNP